MTSVLSATLLVSSHAHTKFTVVDNINPSTGNSALPDAVLKVVIGSAIASHKDTPPTFVYNICMSKESPVMVSVLRTTAATPSMGVPEVTVTPPTIACVASV